MSCLDNSGYVTAGNSPLARGYPCFVGRNDKQLQGTKIVTIYVYIGNCIHHCICNVWEVITYTF